MALPSREFVISEVDREFRLQHPEAPGILDPSDAGQAELIRQWWEMFEQFVNATVDSHYYRFFPASPVLDPNNPEHAQLIEYWNDIHSIIHDGAPGKYQWDESTLQTAEPASDPTSAPPPTGAAGPQPDSGVAMDESALREWVHLTLEGNHIVGDTAEVLGLLARTAGAGEHSALVVFGEALGPVGMIASVIIVLWATVHAFGTGRRMQEQEGFCYGIMWQTFGLPDADKHFEDWAGDTAEELHESFFEGIASGREKAQDVTVHNRVMLLVAYFQANGDDLATAQGKVLNQLWLKVRENEHGRDWLIWPTPAAFGT